MKFIILLKKTKIINSSLPEALPVLLNAKEPIYTYLQEEIRAEGLVRNLPAFSRFLEVAALCSGQQLNYVNVGNDAMVNPRTIKDYFQILNDTFLGRELPPYRKTKTRKSVATPKFYLFDNGVWNTLLGRFELSHKTKEFGEAMEHRVFHEICAFLDYNRLDAPLTYWRPQKQDAEVDFIIGDDIAIEVKGTTRVNSSDLKGIMLLSKELKLKRKIIVCNEKAVRKTDQNFEILPFEVFCRKLWANEII